MPDTPSPSAEDVLTQLVTGPSISEVASTFLRPALKARYPDLKIDPVLATVVTPTWVINDQNVRPGNNLYESLTDVLVRLGLSGTTVTYIDGEHFLTLQPESEPTPQLAVKIDALGCLLNELAPLLFTAYQQQQIDYWNHNTSPSTPRWHELSASLHTLWNVDNVTDWDEDQKAMAFALYDYPDRARRRPHDKYLSKACLIDFDSLNNQTSEHLRLLDIAVLVGTLGSRTLVITHSIAQGFKRYESLEALGETLSGYIDASTNDQTLQWRLFEPDGDFFDHQACALIALEAEAIGALDVFQTAAPARATAKASAAAKRFSDLDALPSSHFSEVQRRLPKWLINASPLDLTRYSRHLMDLVSQREKDEGKAFLDGIPTLSDFTLQTLRAQMIKDHSAAADLKLEDIQISITSLIVLGAFVVPGKTQTLTLSLVELALQNLIAIPLGNKTVQLKDGQSVPVWMTPTYLETLVTQVNIGATYPARIKSKLFHSMHETWRRQGLYSRQLRIQLPLQTLQHKIRGEAGIDERGYRYIVAAMQPDAANRHVDGQEIVIRPLAFVPGDRTEPYADEVANMFVIGPKSANQGPCLLYRPLLDPALMQFPCEANLLYAIKHDKGLRQSVLAWLSDDVRFNYSQYVFPGQLPSIWTLTQLLVDPTSAFGKMGAVSLSKKVIDGDALATLFTANANAMITLSDRQTVSNSEARWATFKQGAWMLFNIALPFLGRTVSTAAWVWQIMDDLQVAVDANENDDSATAWSALTDLFLTLGMVLAHHAAARPTPAEPSPGKALAPTKPSQTAEAPKVSLARLPDISIHSLPSSHETSLHSIGALSPSGLGAFLDELAIAQPKGLASPSKETDPHQHLSALKQNWYAKVGQRWFEVTVTDGDDVQIIDSRQSPPRTGPLMISNAKGEWFIDTRLKLRAGGKGLKQLRAQNTQRKAELKEQLSAFDDQVPTLEADLQNAEKAATAPATSNEASRKQLLETLDTQMTTISTNLDQLKLFNTLETIPNYRAVMVTRLEKQLWLTAKWFKQQNSAFRQLMGASLALFEQTTTETMQTARQTHQQASDLTAMFISKIEFAHSRFEELKLLGKDAAEVVREYKGSLPPFALQDMKLFQISLAQELGLSDSGTIATAEARRTLENIVDDVGLTILSSWDLIADENVLNLPERIDGLSDLVEQFATIDQRIGGLATDYPGELLQTPLDLMRQRIDVFNQLTGKHLAGLLRERQTLEPQPGPSRPPSAPQKRIIKTRYKGVVVGKPRSNAKGSDTGLVDVMSPMTGKVISTFHEKSPGIWVERITNSPVATGTKKPNLSASVQKGQALLQAQEAFIRNAEAQSKKPQRIPLEIEEMFHQQANRLEEAIDLIDEALTSSNSTEGGPGSAATLTKQLNEAATRLYNQGRLIRISMTKQQLPTASRIEWLHGEGEVDIVKNPVRLKLKGRAKDYLDEYEIRDHATHEVLWYAHFHYPHADTVTEAYTAAHLKTKAQQLLGGALDLRKPTTNNELIAIYRSEISPQLAKTLFFSKAPRVHRP
ncbi:dermonecrotic toxin domain-containing protein [Pseudomonas brassicacearum]|uniref:Uncharacterized protein n=1 Tax=Pseudomonas brassicacearum TaxID=930166 RepID=A0A423JCG2_9PSED|nr:DUF6543 domain-containing protein [Pseudomonas brassicacearum]RON35411.1 hypothetical protein BK664_21290 [Pseudomonas brassicacearum]